MFSARAIEEKLWEKGEKEISARTIFSFPVTIPESALTWTVAHIGPGQDFSLRTWLSTTPGGMSPHSISQAIKEFSPSTAAAHYFVGLDAEAVDEPAKPNPGLPWVVVPGDYWFNIANLSGTATHYAIGTLPRGALTVPVVEKYTGTGSTGIVTGAPPIGQEIRGIITGL